MTLEMDEDVNIADTLNCHLRGGLMPTNENVALALSWRP